MAKKREGVSRAETLRRLHATPSVLVAAINAGVLATHDDGSFVETTVVECETDLGKFRNILAEHKPINATESAALLGISVPVFKKAVAATNLQPCDEGTWKYGTVLYWRTFEVAELRGWLLKHYKNNPKMLLRLGVTPEAGSPATRPSDEKLAAILDKATTDPYVALTVATAYETWKPAMAAQRSRAYSFALVAEKPTPRVARLLELFRVCGEGDVETNFATAHATVEQALCTTLVCVPWLAARLHVEPGVLNFRAKNSLAQRSTVTRWLENNADKVCAAKQEFLAGQEREALFVAVEKEVEQHKRDKIMQAQKAAARRRAQLEYERSSPSRTPVSASYTKPTGSADVSTTYDTSAGADITCGKQVTAHANKNIH